MNVETEREEMLSVTERDLVERMRCTLAPINRSFTMRVPGGASFQYVVGALVYQNPLRIDFKAYQPGEIGQVFIGPCLLLTDELFFEDGLALSFRKEIENAFNHFNEYAEDPYG